MALRLVKSSARRSVASRLLRRSEFIEFIQRLAKAQARADAKDLIERAATLQRDASKAAAKRRRRIDRASKFKP
jgi:hypothetical protein